MMDDICIERMKQQWECMPPTVHYGQLIHAVVEKSGKTEDAVRKMCSLWTYKDYAKYLDINK